MLPRASWALRNFAVPSVGRRRPDDARFHGEFTTEHDNDLGHEVNVDATSLGSVDQYLTPQPDAVPVRSPAPY
jgi:hypothetical protein